MHHRRSYDSQEVVYLHFIHTILQDREKFMMCMMMLTLVSLTLLSSLYAVHVILGDLVSGLQAYGWGLLGGGVGSFGGVTSILSGLLGL